MAGNTAEVVELSPVHFAFNGGRAAFRQQQPRPVCPPDDEFLGSCSPAAARWLGYMLERYIECQTGRDIAILLGRDPETVLPLDYSNELSRE
jgi:hypothetical protein